MYLLKHYRGRKPADELSLDRRRRLRRAEDAARRAIEYFDRRRIDIVRGNGTNNPFRDKDNPPNNPENEIPIEQQIQIHQEREHNDPSSTDGDESDSSDNDNNDNLNPVDVQPFDNFVIDESAEDESDSSDNNDDVNNLNPVDPEPVDNFVVDEPVEDMLKSFTVACKNANLKHVQVTSLLKCLRKHKCFSHWPNDCRTIYRTPRTRGNIQPVAGGQYVHFGLEEAILEILQRTPRQLLPDILVLDFSTDGVVLDSQGHIQLWPIQIRVHNIRGSSPEFVGIWAGDSNTHKPTDADEFFDPFINDFLQIIDDHGVMYQGTLRPIEYGCFIADAPARAFILAHTAHNSNKPCSRCTVRRSADDEFNGDVSLRGIDHPLRTDEQYAAREDVEHHQVWLSPLRHLPNFSLVKRTVFDSMHLILGLVKRFLSVLVNGVDNNSLKLNIENIMKINMRLSHIEIYCPSEFSRRPVNISQYSSQKATECRQELDYTGAVVFRGIINPVVYLHFLQLSSAMRILTNPLSNAFEIDFAEDLIKLYVSQAENIFGHRFNTYNLHILLHLAEDRRNFDCGLDEISAFPYENNMQYFSRTCSKPTQHLQQIINRREERKRLREIDEDVVEEPSLIPGKSWTSEDELPPTLHLATNQYRLLKTKKYKINLNDKDNTLMLKDETLCIVQNIILINNEFRLMVRRFLAPINSLFEVGWPSTSFGVFHCSRLSNEIDIISLNDVHGKCFRMPYFAADEADPSPDEWVVSLMPSTV